MKTIIVLAMHGSPPNDFPENEMAELFRLNAQVEGSRGGKHAELERRYSLLHNSLTPL